MPVRVTLARARDGPPPILAAPSNGHRRPGGPPIDAATADRLPPIVGNGWISTWRRSDRAMDVLQYGMAILAFAVALILAALH